MANDRTTSRLRVGDDLIVTSGAHAGSTGKLLRFNKDRSRVFVEGVNKIRRHEKPQPALGRDGGIIEKEASIHSSNVAVSVNGQATRVGYRFNDEGKKVRFAKSTGEAL